MLFEADIKTFFINRNINFDANLSLTINQANDLLDEVSDRLSQSFANFVGLCFLETKDSHNTDLIFNFSSWEDLYECYLEFMIGYLGYKA